MKHSDFNKGTYPTTGDARPVYTTVTWDQGEIWWQQKTNSSKKEEIWRSFVIGCPFSALRFLLSSDFTFRVAKLRVTWGFLYKLRKMRKIRRKLVNYIFKMANLKRVYITSLVVFVYAIIIIFEIWTCILLDLATVEIKIKI